MFLRDAIDDLIASKDLTPSAERWYRQKLAYFQEWCAGQGVERVEDLTQRHCNLFRKHLQAQTNQANGKPYTLQTVHGYMRCVRLFVNWCERNRLFGGVGRIEMPKKGTKIIKTFSPEHISGMFLACDEGESPQLVARDKAILAVLLDCGVRLSELCGLTLENTHLTGNDPYIMVDGKGRKQREIGLGKKSRQYLGRYLHQYRERLGPDPKERHVFIARGGTPLRPEAVDRLIERLGARAGVEGVRVSPHTCRHTFAVNYLRGGGDVMRLSRLLGHSDLATTQIYLRDFHSRDARADRRSVLDSL